MKTVSLWNDVEMPCVGYGTFPQKASLERTVPMAVGNGYRLIDASDNYHNEEFVGRGLAACGEVRQDICVVTKFSQPLKTGRLAACFAASERKLGGRVDVYLLHWPYPFLWRLQWRKMEELYLAGRCRAIGVCNFDRKMLEKLLSFCRVKPMVDQFERHPVFQQGETAVFCRENGVQVMCYSPLARMDERLMKNGVLEGIASRHGKTVGQVVLRWSVERGDVPIPASGSESHVRENFDVFDFSLTDDEMKAIDALESGCRVRFDPSRRFSFSEKARFLWCRIKLAVKGVVAVFGRGGAK